MLSKAGFGIGTEGHEPTASRRSCSIEHCHSSTRLLAAYKERALADHVISL